MKTNWDARATYCFFSTVEICSNNPSWPPLQPPTHIQTFLEQRRISWSISKNTTFNIWNHTWKRSHERRMENQFTQSHIFRNFRRESYTSNRVLEMVLPDASFEPVHTQLNMCKKNSKFKMTSIRTGQSLLTLFIIVLVA